jgi:hypothetical protein
MRSIAQRRARKLSTCVQRVHGDARLNVKAFQASWRKPSRAEVQVDCQQGTGRFKRHVRLLEKER